jgi:hypothetical protein
MRILRPFFLIAITVMAGGLVQATICHAGPNSQAKDAYAKGNYIECVQTLVGELRKKPDHQDNIILMDTVVPLYANMLKSTADEAMQSQSWDAAVTSFDGLKQLGTLLAGLPPVPKGEKKNKQPYTFTHHVPDMSTDRKTAADNSAEAHYQEAAKLEAASKWRGAAVEYRLAQRYYPSYKEASERYTECRGKAVVKVCVMPFEDKTGKGYGALGDVLTEQLISTAMGGNPEFIQFVTRDFVNQILQEQGAGQSGAIDPTSAAKVGKVAGVQSFVFGKLLTITENFPQQRDQKGTNTTTEDTKQGKIVKQVVYTLHQLQGKITVAASFQVVDVSTSAIKLTEKLENVQSDDTAWITFTGDEDAIPYEIVQQSKGERALTTPAEMAGKAVNELGAQLAQRLLTVF